MIKALFEQVATPSKLGPLNIVEVLNWAGNTLNRVDQAAFFARFEEIVRKVCEERFSIVTDW